MEFEIRDAAPEDATDELLYISAAPYYDAYAGSEDLARRILRAVWPKPRHNASYEVCRVAVSRQDGSIVGVCIAFPLEDGERLASRFVSLTLVRIPFWRWPSVLAHLRAAGRLAPRHPPRSLYIDALAVVEAARRRGVARALLDDAAARAAARSLEGVALDTGITNAPARRLYESSGFETGDVRHAPDERTARAIGGPGFVSYFRPARS